MRHELEYTGGYTQQNVNNKTQFMKIKLVRVEQENTRGTVYVHVGLSCVA